MTSRTWTERSWDDSPLPHRLPQRGFPVHLCADAYVVDFYGQNDTASRSPVAALLADYTRYQPVTGIPVERLRTAIKAQADIWRERARTDCDGSYASACRRCADELEGK